MKKMCLIFLMLCLFLTGCSSKELEVINKDTFYDVLGNTNVEFILSDTGESYKDNSYIIESYAANNDEYNIKIEFITYDTAENAEKVLESHMESFRNLKSTAASEKNVTGKNYHKYILISNNYYMTSVRVDNTLVFTKTPLSNKATVENIYNSLGY